MLVSKNILGLVPYKPGKSIAATKKEHNLDKVYKLASNESPVGLSEKVKQALKQEVENLHRYPDPNCTQLKDLLAKKYDVTPEEIVVGNGSNELIDLLIRTFCVDNDRLLTSESSFIAYKICATAANIHVDEVPLNDQMQLDINSFVNKLSESSDYKLIFVANPNNPTGTYLPESKIVELLEATKDLQNTLVVLDEAYNDFVRAKDFPNSQKLQKKYPQVVILKTLSKVFGLAGLRVGYIIADKMVCNYINRIRNPFNVNHLAQVAAIAAFEDTEFLERAQAVNWQGLDYFYNEFEKMEVTYWPSQANFVLFDTGFDSQVVFDKLLKKGVITRPVKPYKLMTHLRVSVGTGEENQVAMQEIKKVLNELRSHN